VVSILPGGRGSYRLETREGWVLRVDPRQDLEAQWSRFERSAEWVRRHHPERRCLDLRWDGKVVLEASEEGGGIIHG
jgi:hypothetical protein